MWWSYFGKHGKVGQARGCTDEFICVQDVWSHTDSVSSTQLQDSVWLKLGPWWSGHVTILSIHDRPSQNLSRTSCVRHGEWQSQKRRNPYHILSGCELPASHVRNRRRSCYRIAWNHKLQAARAHFCRLIFRGLAEESITLWSYLRRSTL